MILSLFQILVANHPRLFVETTMICTVIMQLSLTFCILNILTIYFLVYVDASADCNSMTFTLSDTSSIIAGRSWTVRITQYDSGFENLAPAGCTQYFWNKEDSEGILYSYNYNSGNGPHLADQKQVVCIRREENKNTICYSAADNDIAISGVAGNIICSYLSYISYNQCLFSYCRHSIILWWL